METMQIAYNNSTENIIEMKWQDGTMRRLYALNRIANEFLAACCGVRERIGK